MGTGRTPKVFASVLGFYAHSVLEHQRWARAMAVDSRVPCAYTFAYSKHACTCIHTYSHIHVHVLVCFACTLQNMSLNTDVPDKCPASTARLPAEFDFAARPRPAPRARARRCAWPFLGHGSTPPPRLARVIFNRHCCWAEQPSDVRLRACT